MSEELAAEEKDVPADSGSDTHDRVIIRAWPEVIYLWPLFIASIASGIISAKFPDSLTAAYLFLFTFFFCIIVMTLEFDRIKTILICVIIILLVVLLLYNRGFAERLLTFFLSGKFSVSASLYFDIAGILAIVFGVMFISTRFNYYELNSNELVHHHGILGDRERYPAPNLRHQKEIPDVFEWLLARSGRLIFTPQGERHTIVINNVINVNKVEGKIDKILERIRVKIDKD